MEVITDQCGVFNRHYKQDNVGFFHEKEHLAIWIVDAMPFGPRVKEFSGYLFVLTQLATESSGENVVLRHSSLLLSRKNLRKWREMGGEIILMGNHQYKTREK